MYVSAILRRQKLLICRAKSVKKLDIPERISYKTSEFWLITCCHRLSGRRIVVVLFSQRPKDAVKIGDVKLAADVMLNIRLQQHKIMDEITLLVAENDHLSTTLMQVHESPQAVADVVNRRGVNVVVRQVKLDPTEAWNAEDHTAMFKQAIDIEERNELKRGK